MDYFSIGLNIFCLIAQGIMHVYFCASLTGKKQKAYHFAIYIFIFCILDWIASSDNPLPPTGTGLSNIKAVTEKYHGVMLTEKIERRFSLNVLLNLSIHPESLSIQKP